MMPERSALTLLMIAATVCVSRVPAQQLNYLFRNGEESYQCFRIPAIVVSKGGTLLAFANPASSSSRTSMTVRISRDEGTSWELRKVVYDGPSAYSGLIALPDGNLACLFEAGVKSPYEWIAFRELSLEEFGK
jgi:hypothetical protein